MEEIGENEHVLVLDDERGEYVLLTMRDLKPKELWDSEFAKAEGDVARAK